MSTVACPNCGKAVEWSDSARWRPFCSERCRLIDLGEWISESHRIAGEPANTDEPEQDVPESTAGDPSDTSP
jgi:endogenous inhibitor of DNA gyrase (YacG/DUF329 family)